MAKRSYMEHDEMNDHVDDNKDKGGMTVRQAGQKGGEQTSQRHGVEFYEGIGRKGGQRVRELTEKGKEVEEDNTPRRILQDDDDLDDII